MRDDYLIRQKPMHALLVFAAPIILGNLFQQTYTMVDSAMVGRFVSEQALAAVGASYSLTNIFICVAIGGGIGASVMVSRYFGAGKLGEMKTAVYTALLVFLGIGLSLGLVGLVLGRQIMVLLNTPGDVLDMAAAYLRIYFAGLPFLFMYNILSSMFNALGKSRIPLGFLIFSSLFNIGLDWYFVTRLSMGVTGVAWATLIAQGISAMLSFGVLLGLLRGMACPSAGIFAVSELLPIAKIALPSILQQSTVSIGMMLVQSVVNSFGSEALAGFSAAMRVESLCIVPMTGIGSALSSFTAQNLGAGSPKRVVEGYHAAVKLVIAFAVLIAVTLNLFTDQIITAFLGEEGTRTAMETGIGYLRFMSVFFCLIGFKTSTDGLLRGAGDMTMFTIANLVNLGIRVAVAMIFAPKYGISVVWTAVPIGWFANWAISYLEYRTGKWQQKLPAMTAA